MPRYFFDVCDEDGAFTDEVGMELPDMDTAIKEARRALADMMRDALRDQNRGAMAIAIRDGADGPVILSVTLTTQSPAGVSGASDGERRLEE
jgi:hypothetical protein